MSPTLMMYLYIDTCLDMCAGMRIGMRIGVCIDAHAAVRRLHAFGRARHLVGDVVLAAPVEI